MSGPKFKRLFIAPALHVGFQADRVPDGLPCSALLVCLACCCAACFVWIQMRQQATDLLLQRLQSDVFSWSVAVTRVVQPLCLARPFDKTSCSCSICPIDCWLICCTCCASLAAVPAAGSPRLARVIGHLQHVPCASSSSVEVFSSSAPHLFFMTFHDGVAGSCGCDSSSVASSGASSASSSAACGLAVFPRRRGLAPAQSENQQGRQYPMTALSAWSLI